MLFRLLLIDFLINVQWQILYAFSGKESINNKVGFAKWVKCDEGQKFLLALKNEGKFDRRNFALQQVTYIPLKEFYHGSLSCSSCGTF